MRRLFAILAVLALVLVGLGLAIRMWGFGLVRITGTSMNQTLMNGDVVLVTRFDYLFGGAPSFGDVVECRFPGRGDTYIKRVIGLPGDRVAFSEGSFYQNGFVISEPYVSSPTEDYEIALGDDQYLLLGDNRAESYDSRMPDMGPVGKDAFYGRVRAIVWPLRRLGRFY